MEGENAIIRRHGHEEEDQLAGSLEGTEHRLSRVLLLHHSSRSHSV